MFIPRGTTLYENLATSYVLVDSLIADLCEGGFSGMVEVTLRRADAHIVMVRGRVGAVVFARGGNSIDAKTDYSRTTVSEIAAAARLERGRVSIYSYGPETAETIAAPTAAEALYSQLSSEFADLEKVILKLTRERDRQWFVEVATTNGVSGLVHMTPDRCFVLVARDGLLREPCETAEPMANQALRGLLDETRLMGGIFDVYFRGLNDPLALGAPVANEDESPEPAPEAPIDVADAVKEAKAVFDSLSLDETPASTRDRIPAGPNDASIDEASLKLRDEKHAESAESQDATHDRVPFVRPEMEDRPEPLSAQVALPQLPLTVVPDQRGVSAPPLDTSNGAAGGGPVANLASAQPLVDLNASGPVEPAQYARSLHEEDPIPVEEIPVSLDATSISPDDDPFPYEDADLPKAESADSPAEPMLANHLPEEAVSNAVQTAAAGKYARRLSTDDLLLVPDDLRATGLLKRGSQADVLAEIKRLMSEMLRTVEESIRAAGERENFAMRLRAGQITVAERFPFLDPFGSEFEYLAGEIVFVGEATADEFVYGLGEALAQAIDAAAQGSTQPARVRSHVEEGLQWLLNRQRTELEMYNLDQCIEAILADNQSRGAAN